MQPYYQLRKALLLIVTLLLVLLIPVFLIFISPNAAESQESSQFETVESDDGQIDRLGEWQSQSSQWASNQSYLYSSGDLNEMLSLDFVGTSVEIIYVKHPSFGSFAIDIDNTIVRTVVTTHEETTFDNRAVVDYLDAGHHTLRIYPVEGTIAIDAFVIETQPDISLPNAPILESTWEAQWFDNILNMCTVNTQIDFSSAKNTTIESTIDFNWGSGFPAGSGLTGGDTWGGIFTQSQIFDETTTLAIEGRANNGLRIYDNDVLIYSVGWDSCFESTFSTTHALNAGTHEIQVVYYDSTGSARLEVDFSETTLPTNTPLPTYTGTATFTPTSSNTPSVTNTHNPSITPSYTPASQCSQADNHLFQFSEFLPNGVVSFDITNTSATDGTITWFNFDWPRVNPQWFLREVQIGSATSDFDDPENIVIWSGLDFSPPTYGAATLYSESTWINTPTLISGTPYKLFIEFWGSGTDSVDNYGIGPNDITGFINYGPNCLVFITPVLDLPTLTPSFTPLPSTTFTFTPTRTRTVTPTPTRTRTPTGTQFTPTSTPTNTLVATPGPSPTYTPTLTFTFTPSLTIMPSHTAINACPDYQFTFEKFDSNGLAVFQFANNSNEDAIIWGIRFWWPKLTESMALREVQSGSTTAAFNDPSNTLVWVGNDTTPPLLSSNNNNEPTWMNRVTIPPSSEIRLFYQFDGLGTTDLLDIVGGLPSNFNNSELFMFGSCNISVLRPPTYSPPPNSPTNLTANPTNSTNIFLLWQDNATDENNFVLERSVDGGGTWTTLATPTANTTEYQDSGLSCSTTYHYRIRAFRNTTIQNSSYSNVASATTADCPSIRPILLAPLGTQSSSTFNYQWLAPVGTYAFRVYIAQAGTVILDNWFINGQNGLNCVSATCTIDLNLSYTNGSYVWYVQGYGPGGYTGWSTPGNFSINVPVPSVITKLSPSNQSTVSQAPTTFTWIHDTNATWYYFWLDSTGTWYKASAICTSTCSINQSLSNGGHIWYVQGYGPGGYGSWGSGYNFTLAVPPPDTITRIAPIGAISTATPSFEWQHDPNAVWYQVWIGTAASTVYNQWHQASTICPDTTCTINPNLTFIGNYLWAVRGWSVGGYGDWGSPTNFSYTMSLNAPTGTVNGINIAYQWDDVGPTTTWYQIWVGTSSGAMVINQWIDASTICNGATCSFTKTITLPVGNYQWYLQPYGPSYGYGPWSMAKTFAVN